MQIGHIPIVVIDYNAWKKRVAKRQQNEHKVDVEEKLIRKMTVEEFDTLIDTHIVRETKDMGDLEAPLFYEALQEVLGIEPNADPIEVEGEIVDKQLVLNLPADFE